ncbi:hypothetical protein V6N12_003070 [Hibiscus sabdariffa]|uniref:Uncharacterized protein n=1 Tax=Hibiscus sabdariffa TaxID=183260 RepID=A0ABR2EEE0_9ROSI
MLCIPSIFPPTLDSSFSRFVLRFEISSHSQIPLSLLAFRQDLMYLDLDLSIAFISTDYGVVLESEVADGVAAGGYAVVGGGEGVVVVGGRFVSVGGAFNSC